MASGRHRAGMPPPSTRPGRRMHPEVMTPTVGGGEDQVHKRHAQRQAYANSANEMTVGQIQRCIAVSYWLLVRPIK
jgi:hypothetical protein